MRAEIFEIVINSSGTPVEGASVQVNLRNSTAATVYLDATTGTSVANPILTDANGRIEGWLEEGSYDLVVSATGMTTYTQRYESVVGANLPGKLSSTIGDLTYASAANVLSRLGVGSPTQVLHGGASPTWTAIVSADLPFTGTPTGTKFLRDDLSWQTAGATLYKITAPVTVNTTVAETNLVNQSLAGNSIGTSGVVRLTAWGDILNNNAATVLNRWKLKLGATTLFDTGAGGANSWANGATRYGWRLVAEIMNLGAANSQLASISLRGTMLGGGTTYEADFTTGEGKYIIPANLDAYWAEGFTTAAVDTTATQALVFTVTQGASNINVETKFYGACVEVL